MLVYVVILCDLYQDHFMGVFASREAADKYVEAHGEIDDRPFLIRKERVRS